MTESPFRRVFGYIREDVTSREHNRQVRSPFTPPDPGLTISFSEVAQSLMLLLRKIRSRGKQSMYRIVWCMAAALLAFSTAMPLAAADDRDTCGSHRPGIDEAIATCDRLIRQNPKDAQAYFGRALEYNAKGDDDRAIADYGEAIKLKPKVSGYYEGRGDVYSHKGEYDRAIADYSEAIRLEPKFARFYVDRARVYMSRRDYNRAIADYDEAIKIDAKWPHSNVYDGRGGAYEARGDLDRAIADYDQALKYDPANAEARRHRERATAALATRQTPAKPQTHADITAAILAQLARPQPSPADATADDRGTCMSSFTRSKEEEAIAVCSRLIERDPNDAVAYLRRGSAYHREGDVGHASADFDRAIELNPKDPRGYFGRGKVNASRGQGDHAIADFDQAIRLDPRYAEAYEGRGSVLTSLRQYDRAIADLDEAIRLDPKTPHAYSSRGRAYEERGDLERAITDYDEALRIDPADFLQPQSSTGGPCIPACPGKATGDRLSAGVIIVRRGAPRRPGDRQLQVRLSSRPAQSAPRRRSGGEGAARRRLPDRHARERHRPRRAAGGAAQVPRRGRQGGLGPRLLRGARHPDRQDQLPHPR
jgi:tetratricopeptide (TPR) repeat protein